MAALPQWVMDGIGQQRWLFTHASVGGNLVSGLDDLHAADPDRYRLTTAWLGYNDGELRTDDPPASTVPGTVYECWRGNPGWVDKLTILDNSVRTSGWHQTAVDVVLDKLCYIDQDANAATYLAEMDALVAAFPTTTFVYVTMPLMTSADADNVLRNQYNQAVRAHCAATGALLFDLADMESHDPSGVAQTFTSGGQTYQKLYAGYTDDGGHLDVDGRQRMALGWYAVAAELVRGEVFVETFEGGSNARWSRAQP